MPSYLWILLCGLALMAGCGKSMELEGETFRLDLILPKTVSRAGEDFSRLESQATHLRIELTSRNGFHHTANFPPAEWTQLQLKAVEFPRSDKDRLTIKAEIWDRTKGGDLRSEPYLRGTRTLSAKDYRESGRKHFRLNLQRNRDTSESPISIFPGEFDPAPSLRTAP